MKIRTVVIIILAIISVILVFQNRETVSVHVLFWHQPMSLIVLVFLMLVLGFGIGFILAKATGRKHPPAQ